MADNPSTGLTEADVRKVARLSRLALSDETIRDQQGRLSAVLEYIDRLRELDLEDIEPLTNPADETNHLRADDPGEALSPEDLAALSPESFGPFVRVPKVLGDGGGA
jgi:aspartyl-tRNA(Asn)/glutamyl-tRNA(Gln) amidotransferase subunit C